MKTTEDEIETVPVKEPKGNTNWAVWGIVIGVAIMIGIGIYLNYMETKERNEN